MEVVPFAHMWIFNNKLFSDKFHKISRRFCRWFEKGEIYLGLIKSNYIYICYMNGFLIGRLFFTNYSEKLHIQVITIQPFQYQSDVKHQETSIQFGGNFVGLFI